MWIGTQGGGACRFDGLSFYQFKERDGLAGDIVTGITEDRDGNIWFSTTWGGVTKYNGRKFFLYKQSETNGGVVSSANNTVFTDKSGRVWIGSNDGISIYKGGKFETLNTEKDGLSGNNIRFIKQDTKGHIWVGTFSGLTIITEKQKIIINEKNGLLSNNVSSMEELSDGSYLIGTNKGITKLIMGNFENSSEFQFESTPLEGKEIDITSILSTKEKEIWITTSNNGAYVIKTTGAVQNITKNNGLITNSLNLVFQDRSGNIWIGTSGAGLVKYGNKAFTYYDAVNGLNNNTIFSITSDWDDNIWVSTSDEGVYRYDGNTSVQFDAGKGLGDNSVRASLTDKSGNLWFATKGGLSRYSNGHFRTFTTKDGLPSDNTRALLLDREGRIWIGTYGSGLSIYENNKFTNYSGEDGLPNEFIHSMIQDSKGRIWIGTGNGVCKYENGEFYNYSNNKGFCNNYIGSICEDKFGNIWFGTDRCVVRYDGVDFKNYTMNDGLSSSVIYLLHADKVGHVWVGTNNEIDKISFDSYGQISTIKNYRSKQGFKGVECNSRAIYEDKNGHLWIGTVKGLVEYNPTQDKTNVFAPITHINNIKLFFEDVDWLTYSKDVIPWNNLPSNLVLPHNQNHLTFEFSAINLILPEEVQYRFKLEPFDEAWYKPTNKTSATYSNLPPGNYTFKVIARNEDGVWNQEPASYSFTIEAPWWKEWWVIVLFIAGLFYLFYKASSIKEKRQKEISKELEEKVRERTALIEMQRDEKEVLLKEIHHRVKNNMQVIISLLSIQSGYTKDDAALELFDEAKSRIRSMALIHEKMYQTGDLAQIDFQDYIVALTNDLIGTYSINCDIFLDIKIDRVKFGVDTLIPLGLLFNEIISNSLKYAFADRDKGKITIHLSASENDNSYTLIIGDNGIGMDQNLFEKEEGTLGIELIKIFVSQLDGNIKRLDKKGTIFEIVFFPRD
ncbi:MAG: hypothetical protein KDD41_02790 [Flavobacteriales bacterium]|nr:hypothetical protein [Flavobacteriales bacterium]